MKKGNIIFTTILIVILIILLVLSTKIEYKKEITNDEEITSTEVYKINYTEANYNILVANELDNYINENFNFGEIETNKIFELKTNELLNLVSNEYKSCDGKVEFVKLNETQYKYTIKSDCNDETDKKVTIKGYSNPFNTEEFYRVNGIDKTDYGYLALADKPELDISKDGYAMYLVSFDKVIKYDKDMNEIGQYDIKVANNNIFNIEQMEDGNYTVFSDYNDNNYISIFDENFNLLYTIPTYSENLNYIRMQNGEYFYSYWDKVYKIDKITKDLVLVKEETLDGNYRTIEYKNNILYNTYYDELTNETFIGIYNNNYEISNQIKFDNGNYNVYMNDKIIVSMIGDTPNDYVFTFYDIKNNEEIKKLTINDIMNEIYKLNILKKEYSNYADINLEMMNDGLSLVIKAQYFDENTSKMLLDNILVKIDNELNINFLNLYRANYLEDIIKGLDENYQNKLSSENSYINDNKYIEHITISLDKDMLLYAIYE